MPGDRDYIDRARELRRAMTPAEVILWRELRGRRFAGFKFRRQRPVGPFFADIYCHACRLVIDLDGGSHLDRQRADARRDEFFRRNGVEVLRFWNSSLTDERECVMDAVWDACHRRLAELGRGEGPKTLTPHPSPAEPGEGGKTARREDHYS